MNFLSHFYFDRLSGNPNLVLGTVLPDLVKNARKDWNLHPEKKSDLFTTNAEKDILNGWKRHLTVDRIFHNSSFFTSHTSAIRTAILPVLINSHVRPSFVAHIALELMLDSILLTENVVEADDLYDNLQQADRQALISFLRLNKLDDTELFLGFYDKFLEVRYLNSYREAHNIMYALNRICMRVWPASLSETQILQLSAILITYHENLIASYKDIFEQIESAL